MINRFFHIILFLTLLGGVSCSQGDRHDILLPNEEANACIIPEPKAYQQLGKKKHKLKEVKVDAETVFDNPDEYRIVVKRGKAIITGNAVWAQRLSATRQFALDDRSLFLAGNPKDLARAIDYWLDNPKERENMEKTYIKAAKKYSLAISVRMFEEMLNEEIEEQKS